MRKIFSALCMALMAVAMMGQDPVLTFEKTDHDFGKINEGDGRVSVVFNFKNEGMTPLVLSSVKASCGCTTPTWTKEPVEPGQTGSITVTYNPNGRPGKFHKTVTVTSNATVPQQKVYIRGEVLPKEAKPANKYTIAVGDLNMKAKTIDLGVIVKGQNKTGELEYANLTKEEHNVELQIKKEDSYVINQVTLPTVQPNETGKFIFALDSKKTKLYGPVEVEAYVVIDGKRVQDDTHKLTIKANIVEDFANLTIEDKQNAPIIEVGNRHEAGEVAKGKTLKHRFGVKNIGVNPLEIRRVYCTDSNIRLKAPKTIKSGKSLDIFIEVDTKNMTPGKYNRQIVIISNDNVRSVRTVQLTFEVTE